MMNEIMTAVFAVGACLWGISTLDNIREILWALHDELVQGGDDVPFPEVGTASRREEGQEDYSHIDSMVAYQKAVFWLNARNTDEIKAKPNPVGALRRSGDLKRSIN